MSEKMPILILMPAPAEQPPAEEPKPKLNPKDWNRKYSPGDDKVKHAVAGAAIGIGAWFLAESVLKGIGVSWRCIIILSLLFSVTAVCGAMYSKEVWDSLGHGFPDIWDAICGVMLFLCILLPILITFAYIRLKEVEKGGKE
jgi:hypothetical protein